MTQIVAKYRGNDFEVTFDLKRNLRFDTHALNVYSFTTTTKFF